jgi:hypothetical protein
LLADLQERLEQIGREHGVGASFADRPPRLQLGHYLGLFLFGLLNPAVPTMRGLCAASHLPRLQEEVCARLVSLGSFSEAQAVVDTRLLERVFEELAEEISRRALAGVYRASAPDLNRYRSGLTTENDKISRNSELKTPF